MSLRIRRSRWFCVIVAAALSAACGGGGGDPTPRPTAFDVLSAGGGRPRGAGESGHVCRIDAGRLYCWGDNADSQLGTDTVEGSAVPLQVGTDTDWQSVAAGAGYTCGIRAGMLHCWGLNTPGTSGFYGLLGLGDDYGAIDSVAAPTRVGTDADWVSVTAGQSHTCALRADRAAYCWGRGEGGQLGQGLYEDSNVPIAVSGGFTWDRITAGMGPYTHGLLEDGTLLSWGSSIYGDSSAPQLPSKWRTITDGGFAVCGIRPEGTLWCVGNNQHGQQGQGDREERGQFAQIGTANDWEAVEAGVGFVCAIRGGALYCWGRDMQGELGLGEDPSALTSCVNEEHDNALHWDCLSPELVDDSRVYTTLTVGSRHSCALSGTDVYCWGWNDNGQAGQAASDTPVWVPTLVTTADR
jgi:alpha-tubulin suppressor-like RCC1 family protein